MLVSAGLKTAIPHKANVLAESQKARHKQALVIGPPDIAKARFLSVLNVPRGISLLLKI